MDNNEELKMLQDSIENSISTMKIFKDSINKSIQSASFENMSPLEKKLLQKSEELVSIDLKNPEELLRRQKELTELMSLSK